jgi:hypothetical protein
LGAEVAVWLRHTLNSAAFDYRRVVGPPLIILLCANAWALDRSKSEYFADCLEH